MALLSAHFLGQFQVRLDGVPVQSWRYDKVRALFAFLLLEADRPHSRDKLAALLWPDSSDAAARKSLRQALIYLRAAIGDETAQPPFLLITRESLQFNLTSQYEVDTAVFLTHLSTCARHNHQSVSGCDACTARLAQAAALYQGDFLAGFSIAASLPFEEWLLATRERLRLYAIDALGLLAHAYSQNRNQEAALQTARRQLALDPWHEGAYRLLMRLLAQRGQRTAALAEYERCRRILAEELGIEPSQETITLYEEIRREAADTVQREVVAAAVAPTGPLIPAPLTELIGREAEVTAVQELLHRDNLRLLTLLGPPGVGKTRLALAVAQAMQADFPANLYFVDLTAISDPALLPLAIARSLGVAGKRQKVAPLTRLTRQLRHKRALLVLDNFEQLLAATPAVNDLLQACPALKIVVTSRTPLRLRGEQRYPVAPLPLPAQDDRTELERLRDNPAVALFVARAQAVVPHFALSPENSSAIAAICARVDGLPLAIELAAARVRLLPPPLLLRRLQAATGGVLHLLQPGGADSRPQETLPGAIGWSYNLLPNTGQLLFERLAVFANGFTLEAAEAVCQMGHRPLNLLADMETLLDHSLIYPLEDGRQSERLAMLQTIREFALERLVAGGENELFQQRHADYFITFARVAETDLPGRSHDAWLDRLEQELDNLRSALTWTISQTPDQALALTLVLSPFWHSRAYLREGRLWLERALAASPTPSPSRARAMAAASLLAQRLGDYGPAAAWAEASVGLCRELGDQAALAYALNNWSIVLMSQGDNHRAQEVAAESLALSEAVGDAVGIHRALMVLGQAALHQDQLAAAQDALEKSLAFWRASGDRKNEVLCLVNLGRLRMLRGDYAAVTALITQAVNLSQQSGDRHWELVASWTLGEVALHQGNLGEADAVWRRALAQARELGDHYFMTITLSKLGLLALYRQETAAADQLLQESLALARSSGAQWCLADVTANLGLAASQQQDYARASELLHEGIRMFVNQDAWADAVAVLERLAAVTAAGGQAHRAVVLLAATAAWRQTTGEPLPPHLAAAHAQIIAALRAKLTPAIFTDIWATGKAMTLPELVAEISSSRV
jgi:predicted ATPase/DNA-binding SARP family transcriptional activator